MQWYWKCTVIYAATAAAAAAANDDDVLFQLDVNGECETKYEINSEEPQDISSVSNMVVTKVKNFDKCLTRISFEQGLFAGLPHFPSEKVRPPAVCMHLSA